MNKWNKFCWVFGGFSYIVFLVFICCVGLVAAHHLGGWLAVFLAPLVLFSLGCMVFYFSTPPPIKEKE